MKPSSVIVASAQVLHVAFVALGLAVTASLYEWGYYAWPKYSALWVFPCMGLFFCYLIVERTILSTITETIVKRLSAPKGN